MEHFYHNIQGWFTYPNFYKEIVKQCKEGSHIIEVGSWKGQSTAYMAVEIINANKKIVFDCIDTWDGSEEHKLKTSPFYEPLLETPNALYEHFLKNIESVKPVVNIIRSASLEASKKYTPNTIDCVFIDAAHDYNSVYNDIKTWLLVVKEGGILAGHDYAHPPIKRAVYEILGNDIIHTDEDIWIYKKRKKENECFKIYQKYAGETSDINEHLSTLYTAALKCKHITEFGVRGVVSTWPLLAANPKKVVSYDISRHPNISTAEYYAKKDGINFEFKIGDTRKINIEQTDLLFIDTLHTYKQLTIELSRHHQFVNKYIIMHDTTTYGVKDENDSYHLENIDIDNNKQGLKTAIDDFIENHPEWKIKYIFTNNNGLTVIEKVL